MKTVTVKNPFKKKKKPLKSLYFVRFNLIKKKKKNRYLVGKMDANVKRTRNGNIFILSLKKKNTCRARSYVFYLHFLN